MYVTKRLGGFDILLESMLRQTFRDFELVIVDELYDPRARVLRAHLLLAPVDFPVVHLPVVPYDQPRYGSLCRADNIGYANCRGELVVVLQDYTYVPAEGLQKFWDAYQATQGKALITGYSLRVEGHPVVTLKPHERFMLSMYDHWCDHEPPGAVVAPNTLPIPETLLGSITSEAWETNWAAVPREVVDKLGGVDEDYDHGPASYDNQNISQRAAFLGYFTTLDSTNRALAANHYRYFADRPGAGKDKTTDKSNMLRHLQRMWDIQTGMEPLVKQDYLAPWREMRKTLGYE